MTNETNHYSGEKQNKNESNRNPLIRKKLTHIVPTTQLAKMSIDPKFVELTADVHETILHKSDDCGQQK